jgi:flagellar hook-associated protein 1 FlgK
VQTVNDVNALTSQVALLNGQITASESSGNQAPDLRDARDNIADQLSRLGISRSEMQKDGSLNLYIGGVAVVSGSVSTKLEVRAGASMAIGVVGGTEPLIGVSGALASMIDFINVDASAAQGRLDELAKGIVNGVNEYHASGWTAAGDALGNANWVPASGPTGSRVNFFDAASLTAGTIKLSAEVQADSSVIAAGDVQNATGNSSIALAVGALRDDTGMDALRIRMGANFASAIGFPSGTSYAEQYQETVSDVGINVADAAQQKAVYETLAQQADHRRMSVSGVSIDEELTHMMQYQQAYSAAAKVISTVDQMMQNAH